MQKIVRGISTFHETGAPEVRPLLSHLATHGQKPQAMMITCADSRIMPEELTQADPGDLFMVRNIGNIVPTVEEAIEGNDTSVASAVDYALIALHIKDLVVMGHSGCGAMAALMQGEAPTGHITSWLRHGQRSKDRYEQGLHDHEELSAVDRLSQANVLASLENLANYPSVRERLDSGELTLHGWWFDVANAQVLSYSEREKGFVLLDHAYDVVGSAPTLR